MDQIKPNRFKTHMTFASPGLTTKLTSNMKISESVVNAKTHVKYSYTGGKHHRLVFHGNMKDTSSLKRRKYRVNG